MSLLVRMIDLAWLIGLPSPSDDSLMMSPHRCHDAASSTSHCQAPWGVLHSTPLNMYNDLTTLHFPNNPTLNIKEEEEEYTPLLH